MNINKEQSRFLPTLLTGILAFFALLSYSFIRPITDAMFIQRYGSQALPYVWIATGIMIFLSVTYYNRCIKGNKVLNLILYTSIISFVILLSLWIGIIFKVNHIEAILYIVKDIYIIFIVEQIWTLCSLIYDEASAKKYYGYLMAIGVLGSFLGNIMETIAVDKVGTIYTLTFGLCALILIIFLESFFIYRPELLNFNNPVLDNWKDDVSLSGGFELVFKKKYLFMLLLLILIIQFATAEIDLAFNGFTEKTFTQLDEKSKFFGILNSSIDGLALFFHLTVTGPVLKTLGVFFILFAGPIIQLIGSIAVYIFPILWIITGLKVFNKSCDYSIYRAAKEILYIPLSYEEKNKAKSIIDVMTYRIGKSIAAVFILLLKSIVTLDFSTIIIAIIVSLGIWILVVYILQKEYIKKSFSN